MSFHFTSARGTRVPALIYGTAWKKGATARLVAAAVGLGFRGVDTACQPKHYDEPGVGAGVASCLDQGLLREELYLQTKFTPLAGQDPRSVPYDPKASLAAQVQQSCRVSLANLRTAYLDGLLLHSPISPLARMLEAWREMEALVDGGKVKELGISNCYEPSVLDALWHAARVKPSLVQNRFYAKTGFDRQVRAFCSQKGMIYQSFWTLTANPQLLAHPRLLAVAARHAATPAQTLFRCLTQIGIAPLTGTSSEAHMREDLASFDFELSAPERTELAQLFA